MRFFPLRRARCSSALSMSSNPTRKAKKALKATKVVAETPVATRKGATGDTCEVAEWEWCFRMAVFFEWWKLIVTMRGRWCDNGDMWIVSKQGMRVKKLSCCAKIAFHVLLCARIMALCNPAVAQGSPILLRHCHGVLGKRKKMSREREVNKESQRKDSKRKRCQVNGMSREREVQRKTGREREMSRDFKVKRRKFIIKWFRKRVRHQEQDISRCPARQSSMLLPNCDLSYAGPKKMPTMGRMMMIAPFGLRWFSSRLGIDQRTQKAGATSPDGMCSLAPDLHRKENSVVAQGVEKV